MERPWLLCVTEDGLFCIKDYKKYLTTYEMDVNRAQECFNTLLIPEDKKTGNGLTSDRFKELVYDYWVSQDAVCKGQYILGPFDSHMLDELEAFIKKKSV
ncbi:hypothetical protein LAZ67_2000293 [Cordylochernes scorpioides]|uniref:Uncharacterized protein n=1 Tax=Cordylochernes scorpioides TaxID=51811 RepID=A0ABY6K1E0_9ARAC|nr:hypothetical protein LAZ67_2000293 [Cordylochernes scorpioides]